MMLAGTTTLAGTGMARAGQDSSGSWASAAVKSVVANGVMGSQAGAAFHGEDLVTHAQAAIALSRLAKAVVAGTWRPSPSQAVPISSLKTLHDANWKTRPITRNAFAYDLAHVGDYIANALPRPPADAKDLAQSIVLPTVKVTAAPSSPGYEALTYLSKHRMLAPKSALLTGDSKPLRGDELAAALGALVDGITDTITPLGHDAEGDTPDTTFHKRGAKH
jgi:hypothetical protein